ncbi:MAG: hypothetical protein QW568_01810 [Candidatus Anstonellaceae archaeon]
MPMHEIEKAWKSACRVLLGEEIGGMEEYEGYLLKHLEPTDVKRSAISGRKISISTPLFCGKAKFISNEEREAYDKMLRGQKLDINKIKDIDSALEALAEKLYYAGNIVTGNSHEVEGSDGVHNSSFVYRSSEIYDSKYIAYSDAMRYGEYVFGSNWIAETKFAIKTYETHKVVRCMEAMRIATSSDCYYVAGVEGCLSCMFCFNQRNKRHLIGNLEFQRDEYAALRNKLVGEMRETLKAKKSVPTIVDMVSGKDG